MLAEKKQNKTNSIKEEAKDIDQFVEETLDLDDFENIEDQIPNLNKNFEKMEKDSVINDIDHKKSYQAEKDNNENDQNKKFSENNNFNDSNLNEIPLPSRSKISSSEFNVPSRGYVKLNGPNVSLDLREADVIDTLKLIGKIGDYGIVIIEEKDLTQEEDQLVPKITANFENIGISDVFNSILLSANLQAVVEEKIIFVGKNILNKSLKPKISKTYRLNQVNAASVADYLSTLGAEISKVMVVSGSIDGQEIGDGLINKKEFKDELKNSYGIEGGPLFGIVGTVDLRLQTITLIGSEDQIKTAERYIKSLDVRHRQVALTIKIIDVSLTKNDIRENMFEMIKGSSTIIVNEGLALMTGNSGIPKKPQTGATVEGINDGTPFTDNQFMNWINAKITNDNAKILASPTLILGENPKYSLQAQQVSMIH